jgi:hypothetical protein
MLAAWRAISPRMHAPSHEKTGIFPKSMFSCPTFSPIGHLPFVLSTSSVNRLGVGCIGSSLFGFCRAQRRGI